jgi:putative membrane protein
MWDDHNGYDYNGMNTMMNDGGWLMMMTLLVIVLLGVGLAVVVWLRTRRSPAHGLGPSRLLAERYARGEIDDEEYAHRLKVLGSRSATS